MGYLSRVTHFLCKEDGDISNLTTLKPLLKWTKI